MTLREMSKSNANSFVFNGNYDYLDYATAKSRQKKEAVFSYNLFL
jgi:hypothetical protein